MADRIRTISHGVNCYLVDVGHGFVLIDTGFPGGAKRLDAELAAAGCGPDDLRLVVLTHGDPDHVGNCAHLRKMYGAPIAMHHREAAMAHDGDMGFGRKAKPDRMTLPFRALAWAAGAWTRMTGSDGGIEPFDPDVLLEDGQDLSAWGFDARVVPLPGHSSGSIGILTGQSDLFCGDLLVNVVRPSLHFYIDDMASALDSVNQLRTLGVETVYPGHGKPFPLHQLSIPDRLRTAF